MLANIKNNAYRNDSCIVDGLETKTPNKNAYISPMALQAENRNTLFCS
jgi:hypothetical protein